jgi:flagellar biosynthesis GTPase FlhF
MDEKNVIDEKNLADDESFFQDLLDGFDDDGEEEDDDSSDQQTKKEKQTESERIKNKNAEEARKRREAEEKAKKEAEEKAKKEAEEKAKLESEKIKKKETRESNEEKLGKQLLEFTKKYPDIELRELDNDPNFKKFIDGQLLGKKHFIELYEDFTALKKNLSGKSQEEIERDYHKKSRSAVGSLGTGASATDVGDIYSEDELEKLAAKLPLMNDAEADKIMAKFQKSIDFYSKKK